MTNRFLPRASAALTNAAGPPTAEWRRFFESLAAQTDNAALQAEYLALAARVDALEDGGGSLAEVVGQNGISVSGDLSGDVLRIILAGGLDNLSDVDLTTTPPVSGDALVYDGAAWAPGASGADSSVPYAIPDGETYTVALNKQALFTIPIDLGVGSGLVVDGILVEVD